jgi:hypothetical protein
MRDLTISAIFNDFRGDISRRYELLERRKLLTRRAFLIVRAFFLLSRSEPLQIQRSTFAGASSSNLWRFVRSRRINVYGDTIDEARRLCLKSAEGYYLLLALWSTLSINAPKRATGQGYRGCKNKKHMRGTYRRLIHTAGQQQPDLPGSGWKQHSCTNPELCQSS